MDILIEISKLASVGLISGFFSAYMATRQHINKRWWEVRVEAYKSLIESLSDINHYFESHFMACVKNQDLNKEAMAELEVIWRDNYHKVRKAADSGAFLFSDEVNESLRNFMRAKDEKHYDYYDSLNYNYEESYKCLRAVVLAAKRDLGVNNYAWFKSWLKFAK